MHVHAPTRAHRSAGIGPCYAGAVRTVVVGSGSEGNATIFESGGTRVLVDAGLSVRRVRRRYEEATGEALGRVDAIVLTHHHGDHVAHAGRAARAFDAPVYLTPATARQVTLPEETRTRPYARGGRVRIGALEVHAQPVPHDAPQVALVLRDAADCVGLVTDLGETPRALARHLRDCRTLLLEANHCRELLPWAPYPAFIRERIGGPRGHRANAQCATFLGALKAAPLDRVVLMHLSKKTNDPRRARRAAGAALRGRNVQLEVAHQERPMVLEGREARQLTLGLG